MVTENSEIASFSRKGDWEGYFGNRSSMVRSPNIGEFKRFALFSGGSVHNAFEGAETKGLGNYIL